MILTGLKASRPPAVSSIFTIVMSLLPVAVVVVAFFFLFRMLGGKVGKVAQPPTPPSPKPSHTPPTPKRRPSSEWGSRSVPIDGLASFHFVEGNPYSKPTPPSTPPRRHPCRVCGIPATKRCIHCKSAYYCSKEHCTQASLHSFHRRMDLIP
jgi:hypothetical protein